MTEIPRTPDQIVARIDELTGTNRDMFGIERSRLLDCLPWDRAKKYLKDDAPWTEEAWEEHRRKTTEDVRKDAVGYLTFAWTKANDRKIASCQKSMDHLRGVAWMLGPEGQVLFNYLQKREDYRYFGKPQLVAASEFLGFDWKSVDNDEWVNADGDEPLTAEQALQEVA